jgi:predicted butyrate kinase (DUF1464 family)
MPRVIGFDPGTVTLDLCGLDDGRVFLDRSFPTADAFARPETIAALILDIHRATPLDLIVGPSGYGLPLISARDLTDVDLALACLAAKGETGGIRGLRSFMRMLADAPAPVVFTPGVVHLPSVPAHRKVNRVDMGTADKVCAAVLGIHDQATRRGCDEQDVSFILLELGGAFTAALAVEDGRIVDGSGGTSGPLGLKAAGALDGEVAYLAGTVSKQLLSTGGVASIGGAPDSPAEALVAPTTARGRMAWEAYVESAVKAVASMMVSAPHSREVLLSGRLARIPGVRDEFVRRLATVIPSAPAHNLVGFTPVAKQAAQGAALLADGLAGGRAISLVNALGIRESKGTVLDYLYIISATAARVHLGLG